MLLPILVFSFTVLCASIEKAQGVFYCLDANKKQYKVDETFPVGCTTYQCKNPDALILSQKCPGNDGKCYDIGSTNVPCFNKTNICSCKLVNGVLTLIGSSTVVQYCKDNAGKQYKVGTTFTDQCTTFLCTKDGAIRQLVRCLGNDGVCYDDGSDQVICSDDYMKLCKCSILENGYYQVASYLTTCERKTGTSPCIGGGMRWYELKGYYVSGSNIKTTKNLTRDQCRALCRSYADCKSADWTLNTVGDTLGTCYVNGVKNKPVKGNADKERLQIFQCC